MASYCLCRTVQPAPKPPAESVMQSQIYSFSFFLVLSIFVACSGEEQSLSSVEVVEQATPTNTRANAPKRYPTATVSIDDVAQPIKLTGRVVPLQQATLSSQVPGLVLPTDKLLQEGKFYRKGETLVTIDSEPLRLNLQAARAEFVSALVRLLPTLRSDHPEAYPRYKTFVDNIDPLNTLPKLPTPGSDTTRYYLSANGIEGQYYRIQAQESTLDDFVVRAPFSGKLTQASVEPGSVVQPGQVLGTLSRTDEYEVRAAIPARAANLVKPGQKITLTNRNLGTTYTGTVNRFGAGIDETSQTLTAFIRVSGNDLRTGLYLEAELPGASLSGVSVLPKQVLTRDGKVHIIQDGIVQLQPVEVVDITADEVFLRGLPAGTRVITGGIEGEIVGTSAQ